MEKSIIRRGRIPVEVCIAVGEVLRGTHEVLDELFRRSGAPGDPPPFAHHTKWKTWLRRANEDPNTDALSVLGRVLEEFMEVEQVATEEAFNRWLEDKSRIESLLERHGLEYRLGGRIVERSRDLASQSLEAALKSHDFEPLEIEFERANESVEKDPGAAITAASSLLEALFKAFLEENSIPLPSKETIKPLWSLVQKELGLDPKDQADEDVQRVLSGLISVVDGVGALRTHRGSAHGGTKPRYRVQDRHARLVVSAAHTLAVFVISTWEARKAKAAT